LDRIRLIAGWQTRHVWRDDRSFDKAGFGENRGRIDSMTGYGSDPTWDPQSGEYVTRGSVSWRRDLDVPLGCTINRQPDAQANPLSGPGIAAKPNERAVAKGGSSRCA